MANPYYVQPASPVQGVQGIVQGIERGRERDEQQRLRDDKQAKADNQKRVMGSFFDAMDSNDYGAQRQLMADNPIMAQQFQQMSSLGSEQKDGLKNQMGLDIAMGMSGRDALEKYGASLKSTGAWGQFSDIGTMNPEQLIQEAEISMLGSGEYERLIESREADAKAQGGGIDPDFLKEERSSASQSVKSMKKRASVINSSIGKIKSLVGQIKKGSMNSRRIASGAAIQSLARIVSPGIVTKEDQVTMSGAADPVAAALAAIGREDANLAADLQRALDPTNPDLIDADGLLAVGKSLVGAEAPSILQELSEAESRGKRSGMNQRQYSTLFGDTGSITGLSKYVISDGPSDAPLPSGVTEDDIATTMQAHNMTREQVLAKLRGG